MDKTKLIFRGELIMTYKLVTLNRSTHNNFNNCFSFEGVEEAVLEFERYVMLNKDNKDIVVCLIAFNDKSTKFKEKVNKRQTDKEHCDTKMMYRVVYASIYHKKEPNYMYANMKNLDEAVDFFDRLAKSHPDALVCLCNTFDEDLSLFKYDDSDFPIFKELDRVYNKNKRNNKNMEIKNV